MLRCLVGRPGYARVQRPPTVPWSGSSTITLRAISVLAKQPQSIVVRAARRAHPQLRPQHQQRQLWRGVYGGGAIASASRCAAGLRGGPAVTTKSFSAGERSARRELLLLKTKSSSQSRLYFVSPLPRHRLRMWRFNFLDESCSGTSGIPSHDVQSAHTHVAVTAPRWRIRLDCMMYTTTAVEDTPLLLAVVLSTRKSGGRARGGTQDPE